MADVIEGDRVLERSVCALCNQPIYCIMNHSWTTPTWFHVHSINRLCDIDSERRFIPGFDVNRKATPGNRQLELTL